VINLFFLQRIVTKVSLNKKASQRGMNLKMSLHFCHCTENFALIFAYLEKFYAARIVIYNKVKR